MTPGDSQDAPTLQVGRTLAGRYEVLSLLGQGSFGAVYKATDNVLAETVAVKVILAAKDARADTIERARQELRTARRISHPNVIRIHDIGDADGLTFLSMEYVEGESLQQRINDRRCIPVGEALEIFRQITEGVGAAHRKGVIHRDLKPGNVILDNDGTVKVLDFGIASLGGSSGLTARGTLLGTPEYMAPEQVEGERARERSDLYALGVVLYEMVTGKLPFQGDTPLATAMARLRVRPPDPCSENPAVPGWVGAVIMKCLQREPGDRYRSAKQLQEALDEGASLEEDRPTMAVGSGSVPLPTRSRSRRLLLWILPPVGGLLIAAGVAVPFLSRLGGRAGGEAEALLADGVARVAVLDFEAIRVDDVAQMIAAGLPDEIRSRLAQHDRVRIINIGSGPVDGITLDNLGVEQIMDGRIARIGAQIQVQVAVTSVKGRELWLSVERSVLWDESWSQIDALADAVEQEYVKMLETID